MFESFDRCNMEYFEGILPYPQFDILHSFRTCGYFEYKCGFWGKSFKNPTIYITDYYDLSQAQLDEIMCHEMVHYYLAYMGIDRHCKHGKAFKKQAKQLNKKYGLHIDEYVDTSQYKRSKVAPLLTYWLLRKLGKI